MEKEIKIKATLVINAVDQKGKVVPISVNKVTISEVVFSKITFDKVIVTEI
jgi:hypothetical protein